MEDMDALNPDVVVSFGGGSNIDATKVAEVLRTVGGEIDDYFGTGLVSKAIEKLVSNWDHTWLSRRHQAHQHIY